uniref:Uncharacterized protein n=1 Tax=Anopheles atroparvus TaxID=41427 RepID=A0A182JL52_ANOAO
MDGRAIVGTAGVPWTAWTAGDTPFDGFLFGTTTTDAEVRCQRPPMVAAADGMIACPPPSRAAPFSNMPSRLSSSLPGSVVLPLLGATPGLSGSPANRSRFSLDIRPESSLQSLSWYESLVVAAIIIINGGGLGVCVAGGGGGVGVARVTRIGVGGTITPSPRSGPATVVGRTIVVWGVKEARRALLGTLLLLPINELVERVFRLPASALPMVDDVVVVVTLASWEQLLFCFTRAGDFRGAGATVSAGGFGHGFPPPPVLTVVRDAFADPLDRFPPPFASLPCATGEPSELCLPCANRLPSATAASLLLATLPRPAAVGPPVTLPPGAASEAASFLSPPPVRASDARGPPPATVDVDDDPLLPDVVVVVVVLVVVVVVAAAAAAAAGCERLTFPPVAVRQWNVDEVLLLSTCTGVMSTDLLLLEGAPRGHRRAAVMLR